METPLRVFLCSTFSDLTAERKAVLDAIRRLQLQHDSMEFFGARANQPIETCLAEVRASNVLVVVVGHSYGTLVPKLKVSFSQAEYEEGYKLKKPCLVYLRDDNVPVLPKFVERDSKKQKLLANWKITLQERHTVASFKESTDLAVQVAADLGRIIRELEEHDAQRVSPAIRDVPDDQKPTVQRRKTPTSKSVYRIFTLQRIILVAIGLLIIGALLFMFNRNYSEDVNAGVNSNQNVESMVKPLFVIKRNSDKVHSNYNKQGNTVMFSIPITIENTSSRAESVHYLAGRVGVIDLSEDDLTDSSKVSMYEGHSPALTEGYFEYDNTTNLIQPGSHQYTFSVRIGYNDLPIEKMTRESQQQLFMEFKDSNDVPYKEQLICFTAVKINLGIQPKTLDYQQCSN